MAEKIRVVMVNNPITSNIKHMRRKQKDTDRFSENYKELKISVNHAQKTYQHIRYQHIKNQFRYRKTKRQQILKELTGSINQYIIDQQDFSSQ